MNRGDWQATVHGPAKSWTQLSNFHFTSSSSTWSENPSFPILLKRAALYAWHIYLIFLYSNNHLLTYNIIIVQLLSHVWLFVTTWTAARQASLSFTVSRSLLKLVSIELVMPSNHLVLCRPLLPFVSLCTTKSTSAYLSAHSAQLECKPYGGRDFALLVYCCILRP